MGPETIYRLLRNLLNRQQYICTVNSVILNITRFIIEFLNSNKFQILFFHNKVYHFKFWALGPKSIYRFLGNFLIRQQYICTVLKNGRNYFIRGVGGGGGVGVQTWYTQLPLYNGPVTHSASNHHKKALEI